MNGIHNEGGCEPGKTGVANWESNLAFLADSGLGVFGSCLASQAVFDRLE